MGRSERHRQFRREHPDRHLIELGQPARPRPALRRIGDPPLLYPRRFFSRDFAGRLDEPDTDWKDRTLWASYGMNYIWHTEGGKGTPGKLIKPQIRPDPLAS